MELTKKELKEKLLNDEYNNDEVIFRLKGYDFDLKYECDDPFQEGANGGIKYCITLTRIKIGDERTALFENTKEEAVESILRQLDGLLKVDNNKYINDDIKRYENIIENLKTKLEGADSVPYTNQGDNNG